MAGRSNLEEFFLTLLWGADVFINPGLYKLNETFEAWDRRSGGSLRRSPSGRAPQRQWSQLQQRKLVVRDTRAKDIVYRLTEQGRAAAMGGVDLAAAWKQAWDGKWRLVLFDLPARDEKLRIRLWRWLRRNHFGYLQGSVWVRPDPIAEVEAVLSDFRDDVEALTVMEASCRKDEENNAIVKGAWDFVEINKRYRAYIDLNKLTSRQAARLRASSKLVGQWLALEKVAWRHAMSIDPLLPRALLPPDYLGQDAWATRVQSFASLAGMTRRSAG